MTRWPVMPARRALATMAITIAVAVLAASCGGSSGASETARGTAADGTSSSTSQATTAPIAPGRDAVLLAAGDIADCKSKGQQATAAVVSAQPVTPIVALGDLAYDHGSIDDFRNCFDPAWGLFKGHLRPALGNHEYETINADGYFTEFPVGVGEKGKGWYSWDLRSWHLIALNSNCYNTGCAADSEQGQWLKADLAAHPAQCTIAYWHHPRFSSGLHGSQVQVDPLWKMVSAAGVDIVLAGHDHDYERFAPIDGVRQFVVGTGGASHYPKAFNVAGSEVWEGNSYGVLQLTLRPDSYDWRFLPAAGSTFTDSGSAKCH
jgi:hypothetical protein